MSEIYEQAIEIMKEVRENVHPETGNLLVVGCSTSTVQGSMYGQNSSDEVAEELYRALMDVFGEGYDIAVQCCEHLNRALVVDRSVAEKYGFDIVNAVPFKKAGGAFGTKHYHSLPDPVVVENIASKANVGIDIGGVMIGMHMRPVVVPVKLHKRMIGEAYILAGCSRLKYIGGERAQYK